MYGFGGTWGTFDPLNAGEPWRFLDQVYFKKSQGKSLFFDGNYPNDPCVRFVSNFNSDSWLHK